MSAMPHGRGHEYARRLAALRADEVLAPEDEAWLADHLEYCDACARVAADYEAQHGLFAELRAYRPAPPRDLWARTSAAMTADRRHSAPAGGRRPRGAPRTSGSLALAPLVALLAIVLVVGVGLLNGDALLPGASAGPTPIAVADAAAIQVITRDSAGNLQIISRPVDQVCPVGVAECGVQPTFSVTAVTGVGTAMSLQGALSPTGGQMVVVARDVGSEGVYIIPVKAVVGSVPTGSLAPTAPGSSTQAGETAAGATSATVPGDSAAPPATSPTEGGSSTAQGTPLTSGAPATSTEPSLATASPGVATPSDRSTAQAASGSQSTWPFASLAPDGSSPLPSLQVTPAPDAAIQIASGVTVVGVPIYSPDGEHLAFAAMPTDGSAGPDIYVWDAGDLQARAITSDHDTWLAGWTANGILASRVTAGIPSTYLLDPLTGNAVPVGAPGTWLPVVSPDGGTAAWWSGSLKLAADGVTWEPDSGSLVLGSWPSTAGSTPQVLATSPLAAWQVRWAEDDSSLAVWLDFQGNGQGGQLSLYRVTPYTPSVDLANPMLAAVPANPDFSLRTGRLAWTTPAAPSPSVVPSTQTPQSAPVVPSPPAVASPPAVPSPQAAPSPQVVQVLAWSGNAIGRLQMVADGSGTVIP